MELFSITYRKKNLLVFNVLYKSGSIEIKKIIGKEKVSLVFYC